MPMMWGGIFATAERIPCLSTPNGSSRTTSRCPESRGVQVRLDGQYVTHREKVTSSADALRTYLNRMTSSVRRQRCPPSPTDRARPAPWRGPLTKHRWHRTPRPFRSRLRYCPSGW